MYFLDFSRVFVVPFFFLFLRSVTFSWLLLFPFISFFLVCLACLFPPSPQRFLRSVLQACLLSIRTQSAHSFLPAHIFFHTVHHSPALCPVSVVLALASPLAINSLSSHPLLQLFQSHSAFIPTVAQHLELTDSLFVSPFLFFCATDTRIILTVFFLQAAFPCGFLRLSDSCRLTAAGFHRRWNRACHTPLHRSKTSRPAHGSPPRLCELLDNLTFPIVLRQILHPFSSAPYWFRGALHSRNSPSLGVLSDTYPFGPHLQDKALSELRNHYPNRHALHRKLWVKFHEELCYQDSRLFRRSFGSLLVLHLSVCSAFISFMN